MSSLCSSVSVSAAIIEASLASLPLDPDSLAYVRDLVEASEDLSTEDILSDIRACLQSLQLDSEEVDAALERMRGACGSGARASERPEGDAVLRDAENDLDNDNESDEEEEEETADKGDEEERFVFRRRGFCSLCHCPNRLSVHHMVPRLILKRNRNHGKQKVNVSKHLVELCSSCHHELHRLWGHRQLSNDCDTVDKILAAEEMQSYLTWKRKKERTSGFFA